MSKGVFLVVSFNDIAEYQKFLKTGNFDLSVYDCKPIYILFPTIDASKMSYLFSWHGSVAVLIDPVVLQKYSFEIMSAWPEGEVLLKGRGSLTKKPVLTKVFNHINSRLQKFYETGMAFRDPKTGKLDDHSSKLNLAFLESHEVKIEPNNLRNHIKGVILKGYTRDLEKKIKELTDVPVLKLRYIYPQWTYSNEVAPFLNSIPCLSSSM
jgi:hypothetical protein